MPFLAPFVSSLVLGCAVCGAADPTLTRSGSEAAFEGRHRATLELRAASFQTVGNPAWAGAGLRVVELRAEPWLVMALRPDLMLSADVPLLGRTLFLGGRARSVPTPGDAEVRLTHTAWRAAPGRVKQRLELGLGTKLPTAPLERDPSGALVPPDLQPGCGSIVPTVTIAHAWSRGVWSGWSSASLLFPVSLREAPDDAHPGDSLRTSVGAQLQPVTWLATRLSASARLDGTGELAGRVVKRSGGASVYVAPEVVWSPTGDVVVSMGASFPVVQEMRGYRATAPVVMASLGIDF